MSTFGPPRSDRRLLPRETRLAVVSFVAVSLIWGSTYLGIRVALEGFSPFAIGAIRFLLAGGLLYAFLRARGEAAPTPRQWGASAITGSLFFVLGNGLVNVAEQRVSSGLASVLVATMPLWATLFERLAGGRTNAREWVGIGLGLSGVVILNLGGEMRASGTGAVCALIAPMAWALGSIAGKRLPLPAGAMRTATQMLAGGAGMALVSAALGERGPGAVPLRAIGAVAYLAVFGSLAGFSAYNYLLHHTRTAVATSYAYVNPVIAVALGVALVGEHVDALGAVGAATILAAVLMITRSKAAASATGGAGAPASSVVTTAPDSVASALAK